ncbi:MAG: hypothetical protein HKP13_05625 [Gammaproteobacteria bacterium]|nr:hypothetical protein [Gammaproteobacteria bacterium]
MSKMHQARSETALRNRDIAQVFANAGAGLVIALVWFLTDFTEPIWYYAFPDLVCVADILILIA